MAVLYMVPPHKMIHKQRVFHGLDGYILQQPSHKFSLRYQHTYIMLSVDVFLNKLYVVCVLTINIS